MPVTELYAFNLICVILLMALYGVALKQVYRPMRISKGEKNGSFTFCSMLEFENAGDILDCRYEITYDGGVYAEGTAAFDLPPMGRTEVFIP